MGLHVGPRYSCNPKQTMDAEGESPAISRLPVPMGMLSSRGSLVNARNSGTGTQLIHKAAISLTQLDHSPSTITFWTHFA